VRTSARSGSSQRSRVGRDLPRRARRLRCSRDRRRARGQIMRRARRVPGPGAVLPDERDMRLGRERPPKIGRGTGIGGWQRGSLTPRMPPSLLPATAPTATRAANSAARLSVVKLLIAKNIATSRTDGITSLAPLVDRRTAHAQGGPLLRSLCAPRLFFAFLNSSSIQRRESSLQESSIEEPMMPTP
jgi:hypothetical protein